MADPTLFAKLLLKDPEEEVTTALGSVYGPPVIKKVLDLLRDSTSFQVAVAVTPCPCIHSLFPPYSSILLMDFLQMSIFGACMARYCNARQHQLSRLSHMWDRAWDLYSKAQAKSRILNL